jgi:hypothetical protein
LCRSKSSTSSGACRLGALRVSFSSSAAGRLVPLWHWPMACNGHPSRASFGEALFPSQRPRAAVLTALPPPPPHVASHAAVRTAGSVCRSVGSVRRLGRLRLLP